MTSRDEGRRALLPSRTRESCFPARAWPSLAWAAELQGIRSPPRRLPRYRGLTHEARRRVRRSWAGHRHRRHAARPAVLALDLRIDLRVGDRRPLVAVRHCDPVRGCAGRDAPAQVHGLGRRDRPLRPHHGQQHGRGHAGADAVGRRGQAGDEGVHAATGHARGRTLGHAVRRGPDVAGPHLPRRRGDAVGWRPWQAAPRRQVEPRTGGCPSRDEAGARGDGEARAHERRLRRAGRDDDGARYAGDEDHWSRRGAAGATRRTSTAAGTRSSPATPA